MKRKKVAIMIDSEFGWSEKEARKKGFNFIPVVIIMDEVEGFSGVDYTLEYIYKNLNKDTIFKTSSSKLGMFEEEYRKALKTADHVLFIGISKHLSGQVNSAKLISESDEFKGKVTIYDSEFIGPWLLHLNDIIIKMMKENQSLENFIKLLDTQKNKMFSWLFTENLDRLYASGRLSKTQYMAGTLLKITPIIPIINGSISKNEIVKTRSVKKGLTTIVKNSINKYNELLKNGNDAEIMTICLGPENDNLIMLEKIFEELGYKIKKRSWLPAAILGHVGLGGVGAGIAVIPKNKEFIKK
ncbi:MAG: DegV family EDD domain-containing protein [Mycoplasmataceae bacterium]|nr:DegV family EDD domain-containing protein [Mycoplasmataceae bacterium]